MAHGSAYRCKQIILAPHNQKQSTLIQTNSGLSHTSSSCYKEVVTSAVHPDMSGDKKRHIRISKTMSWLLRHGAVQQQLLIRNDGYVCVQDLVRSILVCIIHACLTVNGKLCHPKLHGVTFPMLEEIVKTDEKQRYHLLYEPHQPDIPAPSSQLRSWWIRANQGHSLQVSAFIFMVAQLQSSFRIAHRS